MPLPRDGAPDSTLAMLSEGYAFIPNRCRRLDTDIFATRLMLRPAICMSGEEAARIFYQPGRFTRRGALPQTVLRLLQDKGSVATLDGEAHLHRKRMFMSLMTPDSIARLVAAMEAAWRARLPDWQRRERVVLLDEAHAILCRAVCDWAGIKLADSEAEARTRELAAMYQGAGAVGPRLLRGALLRRRTERWARDLLQEVRTRNDVAPPGSPLDTIARHLELDGAPLDSRTAAVELLNLLRPTVAVALYITFAALALHEHPAERDALRGGDDAALEAFAQEVRRLSPFFPAVAGRVQEPFDWRGHRFARGAWVVLDIYGSNRDPRSWTDPEAFRPARFHGHTENPFAPIPQGGGDHLAGHRCAGEWATIALMRSAVRLLTGAMRYEVPEQDLRVDLSRMPAQPASGFVIRGVQPLG
ncbi:MAG TPA: cytochrome P450 [Falsiroseomonas sp.]|jgi:fatty-acid peroxygenase|nr:cytochrome P450 [Falsiroseomonas sp.]